MRKIRIAATTDTQENIVSDKNNVAESETDTDGTQTAQVEEENSKENASKILIAYFTAAENSGVDAVSSASSSKKKIYIVSYDTDSTCLWCAGCHDWSNGKRNHPITSCIFLYANKWRTFTGEKYSYAFCILGICADEPALWLPLEYDDGDGKETGK